MPIRYVYVCICFMQGYRRRRRRKETAGDTVQCAGQAVRLLTQTRPLPPQQPVSLPHKKVCETSNDVIGARKCNFPPFQETMTDRHSDRQTNQPPTNRRTGVQRKVTLPINIFRTSMRGDTHQHFLLISGDNNREVHESLEKKKYVGCIICSRNYPC